MSDLDRDAEIAEDGRKGSIKGEIEVEAPLREQIPERLFARLNKMDIGTKIVDLFQQGNDVRAEWMERQRKMLQDYDEFFDPIYVAPQQWQSTTHLPIALTHGKTIHARMFSAVMGQDPPFTTSARSAANEQRATMVQDLMRYTLKDWANEYQGIEETMDRWVWDWTMRGSAILKPRWSRKFTKFEDVEIFGEPTTTLSADNPLGLTQEFSTIERKERIVSKTIPTFMGPEVMRVPLEKLVIIGGEGDPQKADHVIEAQKLTAHEMFSLADQGIFREDVVREILKSGDDTSTYDQHDLQELEQTINAGMHPEPSHVKTKRYEIFEAYTRVDLDKSGVGSDVVIWVHKQTKKIVRATYLYRLNRAGRRPYFKADFHKRQGQEWGVGVVELLWSLTQEIDAIHNIRVDTGLITSMPWGFYDPSTSMRKENLPIEPGAMIAMPNPSQTVFFPNLGNRTGFGIQEEGILNSAIERLTSINDLTLGTIGGQGPTRTATGVRQLTGETNANLDIFLRRLNRAWKQTLTYIFQLLQDNLPEGFQFRITGNDGHQYWRIVQSRDELKGMYDFELEPNSSNSNPQIQLSMANQIYQLTSNPLDFQLGIFTPIERYESIKNLFQAMGVRDFGRYIRRPDNPPRIFTPLELANRVLAGIDEPLTPEQDLDGYIDWVNAALREKEIIGQFNEGQVRALVAKQREAISLRDALQKAAAQAQNLQQIQQNAAIGTQGQLPTPQLSETPLTNIAPTQGGG